MTGPDRGDTGPPAPPAPADVERGDVRGTVGTQASEGVGGHSGHSGHSGNSGNSGAGGAGGDAGPQGDHARPVPGSPRELFLTYAWISLQSFGGALAVVERTVVQRKRWLDAKQFLGLYAIAQVLPGPSGVSLCVLLGDRFFGLRGAAAALAGFLLVPAVGVLALASLFQHFEHLPRVQGALHGMGAATLALILHTALRMSRTLRGARVGIAVALLTFAAVGLGRLPVSVVVLTLGVASVAWAWRSLRP